MTRIHNGILYEIDSPSYWSLKDYPVEIAFLGDKWMLVCPGSDGEPKVRYFNTRIEAQALIEEAFR